MTSQQNAHLVCKKGVHTQEEVAVAVVEVEEGLASQYQPEEAQGGLFSWWRAEVQVLKSE